jgi:pantothenate kinase type III
VTVSTQPAASRLAVVAVDIGNSAAKWSVRRIDGSRSPLERVSIKAGGWPQEVIRSVRALVRPHLADNAPWADNTSWGDNVSWRIATVCSPARAELIDALRGHFSDQSICNVTWRNVPIKPLVRNPDRLGIDRLLAGWMATRLFPNRRVVVVDAGSAITVDLAGPASEFCGGAILPGLSLQFESLGRGTDALPLLDPRETGDDWLDLAVPATDTVSAIRSGILFGTAGAIDRLAELAATGKSNPSVHGAATVQPADLGPVPGLPLILTGGDASRLSPLLRSAHTVNHRLVLDALLDEAIELADGSDVMSPAQGEPPN